MLKSLVLGWPQSPDHTESALVRLA